jgi:hypothetical protein
MKMAKFEFCDRPSLAEIEWDEGRAPGTPAHALFTMTQRRLLGFLYGQPDLAFYAGELIELTGSGAGATQRELRKFEQAGLLRSSQRRARKFYQANRDCSIYLELAALVQQSFGLVEPLRAAFAPIADQIEAGFVFDGFLQVLSSRPPMEMLLVSSSVHSAFATLEFAIEVAQTRLRRDLQVLVVAPEELREPRWFVGQALARPRVWVFGDEGRLGAMTSGP